MADTTRVDAGGATTHLNSEPTTAIDKQVKVSSAGVTTRVDAGKGSSTQESDSASYQDVGK